MGNLIESLGWKKAAAILIILSVLFLVFVLFSFLGGSNKKQKEQQTQLAVPTEVPSSRLPTSVPQEPINQTYNSEKYKINYPSFWSTRTFPVVGGGTLTHFSPTSSTGEAFPRIDIQATPIASTSTTIAQLLNNLSILKLPQDTITFQGQTAVRLSGVLPFDFKAGNTPVVKKVNKTFLFFDRNNSRYVIDYAYYVDQNQEASINLINRTLATYEFQ